MQVKGAIRQTFDGGSLRETGCGVRSPGGWHAFLWHAVFTRGLAPAWSNGNSPLSVIYLLQWSHRAL